MEEGAAHMKAPVDWYLRQPKEVIYKDVHICQGLGVGTEEEGILVKSNHGSI